MAKAAELAIAAPMVVALRTARMLAAGATPDARDRREFALMGSEKLQAFWESTGAIALQMQRTQQEWALLVTRQWWGAWARAWSVTGWRAPLSMPSFLPLYGPGSSANRARWERSFSQLVESGLTPFHQHVTRNARRLGRVKR